jgi:hypothetical protein
MSTDIHDQTEGRTRQTTTPVQVSTTNDAEFLDAHGIEARFGLKRSLLYALLADGSIRGVSLRRRGQIRGKRLFDVASVRTLLHTQMGNALPG